jgi:hypothetical protein
MLNNNFKIINNKKFEIKFCPNSFYFPKLQSISFSAKDFIPIIQSENLSISLLNQIFQENLLFDVFVLLSD